MRFFITGGAGFVGSNMVSRLVLEGHTVTVYDNLSLGKRKNITDPLKSDKCSLIVGDLLDSNRLREAMTGHDTVIHLAANSDIARALEDTSLDLHQGIIATYNVLEAMRKNEVKKIIFSSSSVVYGEPTVIPTSEDYGPLFPISFYGASKLASEGLIAAFGHNVGIQSWIYRFANITGTPATHGVIYDFIHKLQSDHAHLEVLGNGRQRKPYLHVTDCVDGMLYGFRHANDSVNVFNLGVNDMVDVTTIAEIVIKKMGLSDTEIAYTGGARGWAGDVPVVGLKTERMASIGWKSSMTSREVIERAAEEIVTQLVN